MWTTVLGTELGDPEVDVQWAKASVVDLGGDVWRICDYLSCPQPAHNQKGRGEVSVGSSVDEVPQTKHQMIVALVACLWLSPWIEWSALEPTLPEGGLRRVIDVTDMYFDSRCRCYLYRSRWSSFESVAMPSVPVGYRVVDGNHSGSSVDVNYRSSSRDNFLNIGTTVPKTWTQTVGHTTIRWSDHNSQLQYWSGMRRHSALLHNQRTQSTRSPVTQPNTHSMSKSIAKEMFGWLWLPKLCQIKGQYQITIGRQLLATNSANS